MTNADYLRSLNGYPIPGETIETICTVRGIVPSATFIQVTKAMKCASADVYMWLSTAPNITQGGVSVTLDSDIRVSFRNKALGIYSELGEGNTGRGYGYQGGRL